MTEKKDPDKLIIACMMSGNAFSEECNEIRNQLEGNKNVGFKSM
jgi:hypothetical protein